MILIGIWEPDAFGNWLRILFTDILLYDLDQFDAEEFRGNIFVITNNIQDTFPIIYEIH